MPIHLAQVTRREFLRTSAATLASLTVFRQGFAQGPGRNSFAFLSDTHVSADADTVKRGVNMSDHLKNAVTEVCRLDHPPAGLMINGDCAMTNGLSGDYLQVVRCLQPIREAKIPIHLNLGNHDDRQVFYESVSDVEPGSSPIDSKHVSLIELPEVNLFLIDSLARTNHMTGDLGELQREWLDQSLGQHRDKPAMVVGHHHIQFTPPKEGKDWTGLKDSAAFWELLKSHSQVKAYVYGHTHNWSLKEKEGIHLVNLPPVSYVFSDGVPPAWVLGTFRPDGIDLELRTVDPASPRQGERASLNWT